MKCLPLATVYRRAILLSFLCVLCVSVVPSIAADWIHWRGPEQNGFSREKDLPESWSPDPTMPNSNLVWKQPYGCRSTALIMHGKLYFIGDVGTGIDEQERVVCLDPDTGKLIWEKRFNVWHTSIVSNRVGWTNLAGDPETGNVYAHGTQGLLLCLDGKDGKTVWSHSLTEEYGRVSGYGGRNASPIVDGDLVIVGIVNSSWGDQGRGGNRFVAFDKKDGHVVWWSEPGGQIKGTYYSNPVVAVINGERLLISGGADGALHAMKVRTGQPVWSYLFGSMVINGSPVVGPDGKVYCCHSEENPEPGTDQGRVLCVDATQVKDGKPKFVWKVDGIKAGYSSPILHEDRLYVPDDSAGLHCFDAQKGKKIWSRPYKYGKLARGSPVLADGKIYVAEVNSKFHILKLGTNKVASDHEVFFPAPNGEGFVEINSTPAVANGKVYFGTRDEFFCIGKKDHKAAADKPLPLADEGKADAKNPAAIQVIPADVVVGPGGTQQFTVRSFDKDGRLIGEVKEAAWSLPAPPIPPNAKVGPPPLAGEVKDGKLTTAKERPLQQGYVEAKVGMLTARARVRVVPPMPMKFDFSKVPEGRTPSGWINCQGKYATEKMKDGTVVLKKLSNDARPPLSRVNAYIGLPTMSDYTIQADIRGQEVRDNLPDAGVVANRYTFWLDGKVHPEDKKRRVRITSWDALPRVEKEVIFDWKPDVWYRMKLTVEVKDGKGLVRGKVWKADEKEPDAWTAEVTDPHPNTEGAPAIYGYALGILEDKPGTEIYYNNVSVTPNKKDGSK